LQIIDRRQVTARSIDCLFHRRLDPVEVHTNVVRTAIRAANSVQATLHQPLLQNEMRD
jgi:hypothetical protein